MKKVFLILSLAVIGFSKVSFSENEGVENGTAITKESTEKVETLMNSENVQKKDESTPKTKKKSIFSRLRNKNQMEWQLVWRDEFDGNKLDMSKWAYWENGNPSSQGNYLDENGNLVNDYGFNAKQYYFRDNVKIEDGYLVITIKKEDNKTVLKDGKERKVLYSSGAIHTRNIYSVKYGKIEMRASMPQGAGTWPAFWMWPAEHHQIPGVWADGEIDIVEVYGSYPTKVTGTTHVYLAPAKYQSFTGNDLKIKKNEDLTRFNTYAVEWDDKEVKWLFNGRVYKRFATKKSLKYMDHNPFDKPYFMMINVALENKTGEDGDVHFPTEMKVDYVRVYQKVESSDKDVKKD